MGQFKPIVLVFVQINVATSCEETLNACGVCVRPQSEAVDVEAGSMVTKDSQTDGDRRYGRFYHICEICINPTQRQTLHSIARNGADTINHCPLAKRLR